MMLLTVREGVTTPYSTRLPWNAARPLILSNTWYFWGLHDWLAHGRESFDLCYPPLQNNSTHYQITPLSNIIASDVLSLLYVDWLSSWVCCSLILSSPSNSIVGSSLNAIFFFLSRLTSSLSPFSCSCIVQVSSSAITPSRLAWLSFAYVISRLWLHSWIFLQCWVMVRELICDNSQVNVIVLPLSAIVWSSHFFKCVCFCLARDCFISDCLIIPQQKTLTVLPQCPQDICHIDISGLIKVFTSPLFLDPFHFLWES